MGILSEGVKYTRNPLMEGFTEHWFVTSDGVRIRFLHKGEGMPLIMLHGWCDDADTWMLNAPVFAAKNSVYCLDLRGNGFSYAEYGARLSRLAADLHEIIEGIGEPKVNILGWSMGCSVIWSYIDIFGQNRINKVIFDDEPPRLVASPTYLQSDALIGGADPMDCFKLVSAVSRNGCAWNPDNDAVMKAYDACFPPRADDMKVDYARLPDNVAEYMEMRPPMAEMNDEFMAELLKDHLLLDWRDLIPRISVPVLYLMGDASHIMTPEICSWLTKQIANCKLVNFTAEEFGTHGLNMLCYKKFNRVVMEFLD